MNPELLDRTVIVFADEFSGDISPAPIEGVVVGTTSNSIALRLTSPIKIPSGESALHLVASIRHENRSLSEIAAGLRVLCGITLVPASQFDPSRPCDTSWWRSGGAAIGDVAA